MPSSLLVSPYFSSAQTVIQDNSVPSYAVVAFGQANATSLWTSTDEDENCMLISETTIVGGLGIQLTNAPGAGKSWRFTIRKNRVDTDLSIIISDTATISSDNVTQVTFDPGDEISLGITPTGTPGSSGHVNMMLLLAATNYVLIAGTGPDSFSTWDSTRYPGIIGNVGDGPGTADGEGHVVPINGTLANFVCKIYTTPTVGTSRYFKLYKNGVLQWTHIFLAGQTVFSDFLTQVSVVAGDVITYKSGSEAGTAPVTLAAWGCSFISSNPSSGCPMMVGEPNLNKSSTNFYSIINNRRSSTESRASGYAFGELIFSNMFVFADVSPGVGKSIEVALRENSASSALDLTISDSATTAQDASTTVTIDQGNTYDVMTTPTGTPANGYIAYSFTLKWNGFIFPIDVCDEETENRRFRLDYTADVQRPANDVLNDMLATFAGFLIYSGSKVKLGVEKAENVTQYFGDGSTTAQNATFDPNNIVKDSFNWNLSTIDDRPNRVRVQWVDPDQNYIKVYTQVDDRIDQDDRNTVITKDIALLGITRASQASRMAKMIMAQVKYAPLTISFAARLDSIHCEIGDVIAVTHQSTLFVRRLFRITHMQEAEDETINLTCKEYNASIYDDRVAAGVVQMVTPPFVNPYGALNDPTNITLSEETLTSSGGSYSTSLNVSWTPIPADQLLRLNFYLIQLSVDGGNNYTDVAVAPATVSSIKIPLTNPIVGNTYYVRIRSVSIKGTLSLGTQIASIVLQGDKTPPADVASLSAAYVSDHVALSWPPVMSSDLFGYEIRQGVSSTVWETASVVVTQYVGTTYNVFNPIPGARKFFIKAIDRAGNYSSNAASASVSVPLGNVVFSFDLFSVLTQTQDPLEGTLSSDIEKVPTNDFATDYNRIALEPKTTSTWAEMQQSISTWNALQASGLVFGRPTFVTTQESYITDVIDLGSIITGTFFLDYQNYSQTNDGTISIQISTSMDGITYSAFAGYIDSEYTARYVKFKFLIQALDASAFIRLVAATFYVTVP